MGRKVPTLEARPELPLYLEFAMLAYCQLSTERELGMVAGPIPYTSILQWAHAMDLTDIDEIDDLANVLWKADGMVSDHYKKKPQSLSGKPAPTPGHKPIATGKIVGRP